MSLTYLSGTGDDYLGLGELSPERRARRGSKAAERSAARAARYKAKLERLKAIRAARRARRAAEAAAYKIQSANASTSEAKALSMDEIGRRKKGGDGGGSARQEAREARRQARQERQEARAAIRKAKKEAVQARRAAVKAQRATKRAQMVAARTARAAARQEARAARRAAVPAPMMRRGRGGAAPAPEVEDIEAEVMEDEAPEEAGEEEPGEEADAIEGYLGLDEIGRRKKGGDKAAKKAARKTKRKERREKRGGSVAKKIALAPVRLALFAMMKVNALKIRTKLRQAWQKDKNAVINKIVKKFGFKLDKFLTELNRKESVKLSGAEMGVAIETAIATATPAIIAITALLKQLGINPEAMAKVRGKGGTSGGEGEGSEEDTPTVPGSDEGTPGSNFRLSTPLLLGGAAIAAFLLFRKK
jgi:hypothetical protein